MNITCKYNQKDIVLYQLTKYGIPKKGKIIGIQLYQSCHYLPDRASITYIIMPEEYWNWECDEEIEIPEYNIDCFPKIIKTISN